MAAENSENPKKRRTAVAVTDRDDDRPVITVTGHGARAEQILDVAFASGVKVREDAVLAELLASFDELSPIPVEAVHAVAEVLSHVYAESRRTGEAE